MRRKGEGEGNEEIPATRHDEEEFSGRVDKSEKGLRGGRGGGRRRKISSQTETCPFACSRTPRAFLSPKYQPALPTSRNDRKFGNLTLRSGLDIVLARSPRSFSSGHTLPSRMKSFHRAALLLSTILSSPFGVTFSFPHRARSLLFPVLIFSLDTTCVCAREATHVREIIFVSIKRERKRQQNVLRKKEAEKSKAVLYSGTMEIQWHSFHRLSSSFSSSSFCFALPPGPPVQPARNTENFA